MHVTALYAALAVPVYILLTVLTVRERTRLRVSIGDGGHDSLLRRIRVHGNFVEYVPFALVLMGLAESTGTSHWVLHLAGISLVLGRALHVAGLWPERSNLKFRVPGMMLTMTTLVILALACLVGAGQALF